MKLVFVYGPPAAGKLTVAREVARLTGYKLFHNHLVVDALGAVFEFGSKPFVELREAIWLDVMGVAARSGLEGMIFTFAPERTVREDFVGRLQTAIGEAGGEVVLVRLVCDEAEIERRLSDDSRRGSGKLTSVELYRRLRDEGTFDYRMPAADASFDTTAMSAARVATEIAAGLQAPCGAEDSDRGAHENDEDGPEDTQKGKHP